VSGDTVTINTRTGSFADKTVGTAKLVTVTGVTLTGADAGNYTVSNPTGITANITAKALTISGMTANSKTYDGTTAATLSGGSLVGVETGDAVTFSGTATFINGKNVGTALPVTGVITLAGADKDNYTVSFPAGLTASITAKTLTVTADNVNRPTGVDNPPFTASYLGFVNGETAVTALTGSPSLTTSATITSPKGTYPIIAAVGTLSAINNNYSFIFVDGTLNVGLASQTITFNALPVKTYGDADFAPGATASSGYPVSYTSSNTAVAMIVSNQIHIVGAGSATITANQPGDGTIYGAANPVTQTLTVNQVSTTTTIASSSANPSISGDSVIFTATVTGAGATGTVTFKDGATTLGTGSLSGGTPNTATYSTSALGVGWHSITAAYDGNTNFTVSTSSVISKNVVMADGKLNGSGTVDSTDALKALRIAAGIDTPSAYDLAHGDVAPLANGQRHPDGKIDLGDVVAILRRAVGLPNW
jgi:hypothetical protein